MSGKLTILVVAGEGVGQVNTCIGLAEVLVSRGHRVVFAIDQSFEGKLVSYGFVEEILPLNNDLTKMAGEVAANSLFETGMLSSNTPLESIKLWPKMSFFDDLIDKMRDNEPKLKAIMAKYNPDILIIDEFFGPPSLIHSDKPWVRLYSANPLPIFSHDDMPPALSGFAANGDRSEWKSFRHLSANLFEKQCIKYNEWMRKAGYPECTNNKLMPDSPYLNIYGFPEELDYTDIRPIPPKWLRIDTFMRRGEQDFQLPDKFQDRDETKSKLIYLSMGSMGSVNVNLMKRLIAILSKSNHKFIVSKGIFGDKYELSDNMWGQNSVPQTRVLPLVDVVITHGGNNSVTETFSYGKPMIVMPLFADQFDNAQRVQEKGFGLRLDPFNCSDEELINSIEILLNDKEMKARLLVASKRMLNSDGIQKASNLIEKLVK